MHPTLEAGWFVLVDTSEAPRKGQIVVARHPEQEGTIVIKRVAGVQGDRVSILSDNPDVGVDSRHCGTFAEDAVVAVVVGRVWPQPRWGLRHHSRGARAQP